MRITPLDVRKQEFRKAVRGFDVDEVNAFLATVADEYEAVLRDNKQLRERTLELEDKVSEYRTMEKTLRDTLMTAERVMNEAKDNASKESNLIIKDAELRAQQVLDSFRTQADELRREIIGLQKEKEGYLARFRSLAEAQIQFIDNHQTDFEDIDQRMMSLAQNGNQLRVGQSVTHSAGPIRPESASPTPGVPEPPPSNADNKAPDIPSPPEARRFSEQEFDEWRNYDPANAANRDKRQQISQSGMPYPSAVGAVEPARSESPQQDQQKAEPMESKAQQLETQPVDQLQSGPQPPEVDPQSTATEAASWASSEEHEAEIDRRADEVVEMLNPVDETQPELATEQDESAREDSNPPNEQETEAREDKEEEEEKEEKSGFWNMESFTKGLSDM